ncbi:MAG: ammonium transporter [Gammaproteobacteria bacterium]|nr:ammonium transporter [Gammaproteobacteria bacterium]
MRDSTLISVHMYIGTQSEQGYLTDGVEGGEAIVIGAVGSILCYRGVLFMRKKSGLDDALDVFGVHGIGGIWGAIATGIFAVPAMVESGYEGLIYGNTDLFIGEIVAVIITIVFCFAVSYAVIWLLSKIIDVRMVEDEEVIGADIVEHGEPAYTR